MESPTAEDAFGLPPQPVGIRGKPIALLPAFQGLNPGPQRAGQRIEAQPGVAKAEQAPAGKFGVQIL